MNGSRGADIFFWPFIKGRWTHEEHQAFLRGVRLYERAWEAVASLVVTRTVLQIRTHSQKYFAKINQGLKFPEEPYPSRYDVAAGKSGASAGAYLYDLPRLGQQRQQVKEQRGQQLQASRVGGDDAVAKHIPNSMPDFLAPPEQSPLFMQSRWGGGDDPYNFGGEVEPCLHHSSPLVGVEQPQEMQAVGPAKATHGAGASFIAPPSAGTFSSGCAGSGRPNAGFGFAPGHNDSATGARLDESVGARYPANRGLATSSSPNPGGGTTTAAPPSAPSLSPQSDGFSVYPPLPPSSSSFAPSVAGGSAFDCTSDYASGLAYSGHAASGPAIAVASAASFVGPPGYFAKSLAEAEQGRGSSGSSHQGPVAAGGFGGNPRVKETLSYKAAAWCAVGGAVEAYSLPRQGGGGGMGGGMGRGHHNLCKTPNTSISSATSTTRPWGVVSRGIARPFEGSSGSSRGSTAGSTAPRDFERKTCYPSTSGSRAGL
eukprot:g18645.t1